MKRICITGGAGFIGRHVVRAALERGWLVTSLDLVDYPDEHHKHHTHIVGDVRDRTAVEKALQNGDAMVHLAAEISVQASIEKPEQTHAVNVEGTDVVLSVCQEMGTELVLHASSAAVYGDLEDIPLKETAPLEPLSPYGLSKKMNEEAVRNARERGLNAFSFRFFNVYGPGQSAGGAYSAVIPLFIQRMCRGEQPVVYGDGSTTRDFVHVGDVASALLDTIKHEAEGMNHAVYNVASGKETSLLELVEHIHKALPGRLTQGQPAVPLHRPVRENDVFRSLASIERLTADLDWLPSHDLASAVHAMVKTELEGASR